MLCLNVRRVLLCHIRLTVFYKLISKNEEQKDHGFGERCLGFLLLFVCAAEKTKDYNQ